MPVTESTICSSILGNERRVWLQASSGDSSPHAIFILLDGEYYVERMEVCEVIETLQTSQSVPAFAVAYVSHLDGATRWKESKCNDEFAHFAANELVPGVVHQFQKSSESVPVFLGGLSLTGLAAAHAALRYPDLFAGVLCQSASFWWSDEWLVNECRSAVPTSAMFRISCGSLETKENVDHGPDLFQRVSQIASNRDMRDVLLERGFTVSYEEFNGGHDLASWKADLPRSMNALLETINFRDPAC